MHELDAAERQEEVSEGLPAVRASLQCGCVKAGPTTGVVFCFVFNQAVLVALFYLKGV